MTKKFLHLKGTVLDLGGFKNLQGEGIYGNRYRWQGRLACAVAGRVSAPFFGA
jgi:hypothetical protein